MLSSLAMLLRYMHVLIHSDAYMAIIPPISLHFNFFTKLWTHTKHALKIVITPVSEHKYSSTHKEAVKIPSHLNELSPVHSQCAEQTARP